MGPVRFEERKFRYIVHTKPYNTYIVDCLDGWFTFTYMYVCNNTTSYFPPLYAIVLIRKAFGGMVAMMLMIGSLFWWTSCRLSLACFCGQQHNTSRTLIVCLMDIVTVNYNSSQSMKRRERIFLRCRWRGVMLLLSNQLLAVYTFFFRNFCIGFLCCLWCSTTWWTVSCITSHICT